jgi:gliding motility-associated-like protein
MKKLFLLFFLILSFEKLNAAIFVVTSNADAGTGTLRAAILSANTNGSATADYIYFALPGSTRADVTISLLSELPILKSNLIIDATTQPFAALSHPNIKVVLTRNSSSYFHGFRLDEASDIEVYGLLFNNFKADPAALMPQKTAAILLSHSSKITIGAIGKSNCFVGNFTGIYAFETAQALDNTDIKIAANIFGLQEDKLTAQPNENGILINYLKESVIGGDNPLEGNFFASNIVYQISAVLASGNLKIANNVIGLDGTLLNNFSSANGTGIKTSPGTTSFTPTITNNTICSQSQGILVTGAKNGFLISGNKIGTGITGTENFGNATGILIDQCLAGMIGGNTAADQNTVAYNDKGIIIRISYPVSILRNSLYCNVTTGIGFESMASGIIVPCKISTITSTGATGKYLPNSKVELFYIDSCPNCEGKTWIATMNTDAAGNWSYSGPLTGKITSTGTNSDGATSDFSKPTINDAFRSVPNINCGTVTGSITGIIPYDSNVFEWYDNDGVLVGNNLDLLNVPVGTYYLKSGQNGQCDNISNAYTISYAATIITNKGKVNDASCGTASGSITGIVVNNALPRLWYVSNPPAADTYIRTADALLNVSPGKYYFTVGSGDCLVKSETYVVAGQSATYELRTEKVTNTSCGRANGSITVTGYSANVTFTFKWFDLENNQVGTTETVNNLGVGKYRLVAYTPEGCNNEVGTFDVYEDPLPTIDLSAMQQYLSCDGKTITTTGIAVTGFTDPYRYLWKDKDGNIVSNSLNLNGVSPGIYSLQIADRHDCLVDGPFIDFTNLKSTVLTFANTFSPNGDGINDLWVINGVQNYFNADFSIYSRNGTRIFYSRGYATPFDGIYKGKPIPVGVYYYIIDLKTDCAILTGTLTILR